MKHIIFTLALVFAFLSCKTDSKLNEENEISRLEQKLKEEPSNENAGLLLQEISKTIAADDEVEDKKSLLLRGLTVAREYNIQRSVSFFLLRLVKSYPDDPDYKDHLFDLAKMMARLKNTEAGDILLMGFMYNYKDDPRVAEAKSLLSQDSIEVDPYIQKVAESIFENPDKFGLNRRNAERYVDACEAHAIVYPESEKTPAYLYRAGEIAVALNTFPKALGIYDWLIEKYPAYTKTPNALFAKGYIMEDKLGRNDEAKEVFTQFISTYPDHELADDAKFLIENIGKSDEEIMKIIEAKQAEQDAAKESQ